MRKSPGKWIKAVLFGKKSSKYNVAKGREVSKPASGKAAFIPAKEPACDLVVDPSLIAQPVPCPVARIGENRELRGDGMILSSDEQDDNAQKATNVGLPEDSERERLEQAATKVQAAFRGYRARRAFRALKGIIRLQAVVRGHLVRRQAVACLYCLHRIVKLQALVRGRKVRHSDIGIKLPKKQSPTQLDPKTNVPIQVEKLLVNAFVRKLLRPLPTTMPLHLQYGPGEPNSAWDWLERWTISRAWDSFPQPEKISYLKSQTKHNVTRAVEAKPERRKSSIRQLPNSDAVSGSSKSTSESEKLKRKVRKVPNHLGSSVQEHPQIKIEKVKRNLKKNSNPTIETSIKPEVSTEKPKRTHRKVSNFATPEVLKQHADDSVEKLKRNKAVAVLKHCDEEPTSKPPAAEDKPVDELEEHPASDFQPKQINDGKKDIPLADKELYSRDDKNNNEHERASRRGASLPAKQDCQDIETHSTPRVPRHMALTESAKARLRGQGPPRIEQDGAENNGLTRRHSLPSSTNGKSSLSLGVQSLVQASGRGIRSDRSLLSSRDGNEKVIQTEWRR